MVKICPYCAEEINLQAIKCKHCGEFLSSTYSNKNDFQDKKTSIDEEEIKLKAQEDNFLNERKKGFFESPLNILIITFLTIILTFSYNNKYFYEAFLPFLFCLISHLKIQRGGICSFKIIKKIKVCLSIERTIGIQSNIP